MRDWTGVILSYQCVQISSVSEWMGGSRCLLCKQTTDSQSCHTGILTSLRKWKRRIRRREGKRKKEIKRRQLPHSQLAFSFGGSYLKINSLALCRNSMKKTVSSPAMDTSPLWNPKKGESGSAPQKDSNPTSTSSSLRKKTLQRLQCSPTTNVLCGSWQKVANWRL